MMPNLLVVGAMRSGTTSIYRYLAEHPDIYMSEDKQPHFLAFEGHRPDYRGPGDEAFNTQTVTTLAGYQQLFAPGAGAAYRGEASAMYLYLPAAMAGIARHCPEAHCVAVLR